MKMFVYGSLVTILAVTVSYGEATSTESTLFPTDLPARQWHTFQAKGFSKPVVGVIYRNGGDVPYVGTGNPEVTEQHLRHWPLVRECGVPLGGIGTGCATLRLDGCWGGWSLFNNLNNQDTGAKLIWWTAPVPQLRNVEMPLLGLSVGGKSCVLSLDKLDAVNAAQQIHYWGHYPVADLEYELDAPVRVGLRAWSPFLPGDAVDSNIPGAVFEVRLHNPTPSVQRGTIALSFPGPNEHEMQRKAKFERKEHVTGQFRGVEVSTLVGGWPGPGHDDKYPNGYAVNPSFVPYGYALGVVGPEKIRLGGGLGNRGAAWAAIQDRLPESQSVDPGSSVAVDFALDPGETRTIRFVLAWYAPYWRNTRYINMYHERFRGALEVATLLAGEHESLLERIISWQQVIYAEEQLPECLRDALINCLYLMTKGSAYVRNPGADPRIGILGILEGARVMPMREVMCQAWWGDYAVTYFFPELRLATLRVVAAYQLDDGRMPLQLGINEFDVPAYAHPLVNGFLFAEMVDRLCQRTGDDEITREFYPTIKRAIQFGMKQSLYGDGLITYDPENTPRGQPFDSWAWRGNAAYTAIHWLCGLRVAERMAETAGDAAFAQECRDWIARGSQSMEQTLWNEETRSYDVYNAPGTDIRSDTVFSYQLEGSLSCALLGLPDVVPAHRRAATLDTIERLCVAPVAVGVANSMRPDGTPDTEGGVDSGGILPALGVLLAAEFAYHGKPEVTVEIMEQTLKNLVHEHLYAWDFPQGFFTHQGAVPRGCDDHWAMASWAVPPALFGQDIKKFTAAGSFVDRVMQAAKAGKPARQ